MSTHRILVLGTILAFELRSRMNELMVDVEVDADAAAETADINVTKRYKRRIIKQDTVHRMARMLYKLKARNPMHKRKRQLYQKIYRRKNKMALKRRSEFVKKAKKSLPQPHRTSPSH